MPGTLVVKMVLRLTTCKSSSAKRTSGWDPVFIISSLQPLVSVPSTKCQIQPQNPKKATFHKVIFQISPLWSWAGQVTERSRKFSGPHSRLFSQAAAWSCMELVFTLQSFSSSPNWGKIWTLCISTRSRRRRWRIVQAATRHILSFGCSRRWWLYARVPGRPVDHHCLSARKG